MDKEYAREFRAHKTESDDRLKRIEDRLDAIEAQAAADASSSQAASITTTAKKSTAEATSSEKDAV
ncbi:MAG TPA: hypothetical protein VGC14_02605 [Rhizobium sp.]